MGIGKICEARRLGSSARQKGHPASRWVAGKDGGSLCCGRYFIFGLRFNRGLLALDVRGSSLSFFNFVILSTHKSLYISNVIRLFRVNMKIRLARFNIYLLSLLLLPAFSGDGGDDEAKKTPPDTKRSEDKRTIEGKKHSKDSSTLRLYLETTPAAPDRSQEVPLFRTKPVMVTVEKTPFLDEGNVSQASIVDAEESFLIKIQFDKHGTWLLENMTATSVGKRVAIFSQFGDSQRWLAAPVLTRRISDGVLTFTPDASRAEAERIVSGLNNVAAKLKKKNKF